MPWWLSEPRPELSQGDVIRLAPFGFVQHELRILTPGPTGKAGKSMWEARTVNPLSPTNAEVHLLAQGNVVPCLVLTHSCELDKHAKRSARNRVLVAPVLSVDDTFKRVEDADAVRSQRRISVAYLPEIPVLGDCFADLRMMTLVPREFLRAEVTASMTDEAVELLQTRLAVYFTRKTLALGSAALDEA